MKAVILAAGRGKRLKEATEPSNKCMLTFNGRHLIEYSLENAIRCDAEEIIVVVGYKAAEIINTFGIVYHGIKIQYVFQEEQRGLVHALEQCKPALDGHDFILLLADEIFIDPKPVEMIADFREKNLFTVCGVTRVEDKTQIQKTYCVIHDEQTNKIFRLIEKPRNPLNNIMGTGNCIFRHEIFDYIPYTPINYFRKEKELPDLIQCAIDDGKDVRLAFIGAKYVNINTPEDIAIAENMIR